MIKKIIRFILAWTGGPFLAAIYVFVAILVACIEWLSCEEPDWPLYREVIGEEFFAPLGRAMMFKDCK